MKMYSTKAIQKILIVYMSFMLLPFMADAQCKSWTKRKCNPFLAPYKFNETYNSVQLSPGEEATVNLTFFSGQEYRVVVCAQGQISPVSWKLKSGSQIIFESLADEPKDSFDLKMESTEQLEVVVWVADQENTTGIVDLGCVSILMGFKE